MRIPMNVESKLWAITAVCCVLAPCGLPAMAGCNASTQTVKTASEVCATTLTGFEPIQSQARKLKRKPEDLARDVCATAILAAEFAAANSTPE